MAIPANYGNTLKDEELCRLAAQGDPQAEEQLILRYRRTVLISARSYFLMGGDNEDLVQEGMIGLLKAVRFYDPRRGATFRTFADRCVNHALISAVTKAARNKHLPLNNSISLETPLLDGNSNLSFPQEAETAPSPEDLMITREEFHERLAAIQSQLSHFELRILEYYLEGLSYSEIAQQVGRTVKSVDNAVQRVRRKLSHQELHSSPTTGDSSNR